MTTEIIDVAAEQRWTLWKLEGARRDAIRAGRMHKVFVAAGFACVVFILWRL